MSGAPSSRVGGVLIIAGAATAFVAVISAVRLLLGQPLDEAIVSGAVSAVGILLAIAVIGRLARNPHSRYAVSPALERAMRTGHVPDDVDAARWLQVLRSSRRIERASALVVPILLVVVAVAFFAVREDEHGPIYVAIGIVCAAVAVAAPFYVRRELRQMAEVERQLTARLDPSGASASDPDDGPDAGTPRR